MQPTFATRLIAWQRQHGRHALPWQGADAYRVWLSEIMLQQTQVVTVIPYYQRFVARFPDVTTLAQASEDDVLAHWSGLGYYSRARNLHAAARLVMQQHGGQFPQQFEQILELPGIGRSTAAAICALAYHERHAILDGNVKRVLARYAAIEGYPGDKKIEAQLWQQAEARLPPPPSRGRVGEITNDLAVVFGQPSQMASCFTSSSIRGGFDNGIASYTQALMDLGALICTRSKPQCSICPLQADCQAYQQGRVTQLPTPRPRKVLPEKHSTFLLLRNGSDILLEKRASSGIWGGLWCPPQFEDMQAALAWCALSGVEIIAEKKLPPFTHTFTHFKLHIAPLCVELRRKPLIAAQPGNVWLEMEEALHAAIPTPVRKIILGMRK